MRSFEIAGRKITQDGKPYVIAEIGNNHNGRVDLCKILIERAKANGADAVKLQKRSPASLFTCKLYNSPYENENSFGPTYGAHREFLEFDHDQWVEIVDFARKCDIPLFSTAFDIESVEFLKRYDLPAWKVASGCLKDVFLIESMAETKKPMIISTGGGDWEDVDRVYDLLEYRNIDFCFLHCVASYPNTADKMNLATITSMLDRYEHTIIGLSDHYPGNLMAETAYSLGARVFEKHFTANKSWQGPDHALSMEPEDLHHLVHNLEKIKASMGSGEKTMLHCEQKGIYKMGKGIYARHDIPMSAIITEDMLCIKSPADGLPPYEIGNVIGKRAKLYLPAETPITMEVLK